MITGEIKNRIDTIWDTFFAGGITNPMTVLEQMTYLFFIKMLDDAQKTKEANASFMGVEVKEPTFKQGMWHNPDTDRDVPYEHLRWSVFKNKEAEEMFRLVSRDVFSFIKNLNSDNAHGKVSAYSRFMQDATFLIRNPRTLVKVVENIDSLDMNNRDTMGDVYEYVLGKMAASGHNGQFRTPRHIIRMMVELMQRMSQSYRIFPKHMQVMFYLYQRYLVKLLIFHRQDLQKMVLIYHNHNIILIVMRQNI